LPGCSIVWLKIDYSKFPPWQVLGLPLAWNYCNRQSYYSCLVQKWAVDMNEYACDSLKHNHPRTHVITAIGSKLHSLFYDHT
jgi:hypothetical protein